jgi:toxin ParE1/3/4
VKIRLHEEAQQDITEAALWYDEQVAGLGDEFLAEVDQRIAGLIDRPHAWPVWPRTRQSRFPVRRRLMKRFPYGIAYQVVDETVVVIAVAAHRRRPRYWASRAAR